MKVYVVECDTVPQLAPAGKAWRSRENAQREAARLEGEYFDALTGAGDHTRRFSVREVEVEESEVQQQPEAPLSAAERYRAACEAREKAKEAATQAAREAFGARAQEELFARFPGLESFGWRQYTPSWNDGDVCRFGVEADEPMINGERSADFERGYAYEQDHRTRQYARVERGTRDPRLDWADAAGAFVNSFPKQDLESLFGDPASVTVHRDGRTEVEECDRD